MFLRVFSLFVFKLYFFRVFPKPFKKTVSDQGVCAITTMKSTGLYSVTSQINVAIKCTLISLSLHNASQHIVLNTS